MNEFIIISDGGSINNGDPNSLGYGSFIAMIPTAKNPEVHSETFGDGITNNQAEYLALISALKHLHNALSAISMDMSDVHVTIKVDSQLLVGQLMKGWAVKAPDLVVLHAEAKNLIMRFGKVSFEQISGAEMKKVLGH
jgi:ribonuclease HI